MTFIRIADGKPQIDKKQAICELLGGHLPQFDKDFQELFLELDAGVREQAAGVSREALSNSHGNWYEWLLAAATWNLFQSGKCKFLALLLPNISRFDVASLYKADTADLIYDLREKVETATSVQLITSNPDFVIIDTATVAVPDIFRTKISELTPLILTELDEAYLHFKDKCAFETIVGYASVKASLRPDRRLQIPHEGSLVKAIYTHIQTRKWILNPRGIKYYAIAQEVGEADIKGLKTVATHSITSVSSLPQAAVDDVFAVNSLRQAESVFSKILN